MLTIACCGKNAPHHVLAIHTTVAQILSAIEKRKRVERRARRGMKSWTWNVEVLLVHEWSYLNVSLQDRAQLTWSCESVCDCV